MANKSQFKIDKHESIEQSQYFYQQCGFGTVNDFLWCKDVDYWGKRRDVHGSLNTVKNTIQRVVNLTSDMHKTDETTKLYSGTRSGHFENFEQWKPGDIINLKGFTSSSSSISVAKSFADASKKEQRVIFELNIPKNSQIISLGDKLDFDWEHEILIPPASYEIECVDLEDSGIVIVHLKQKELLNIKDLIRSGLDNIKSRLDKTSQFKAKDIEKLAKKVDKEFETSNYEYPSGSIASIEVVSRESIEDEEYYKRDKEIGHVQSKTYEKPKIQGKIAETESEDQKQIQYLC